MELSQAVNRLQFVNNIALLKRDIVITVRIRGESGAAHAAAILTYFGFSSADETAFEQRFGYNLREHFTRFYSGNDNRQAHRAVGGGFFEVRIPIPANLYEQIKSL